MRILNMGSRDSASVQSFRSKRILLSREAILRFHNEGFTVSNIAKELKCTEPAVRKILKSEFKITPNNPSGQSILKYSREEIKKLYADGLTTKEIAKKLGCALETARRILKELGLKLGRLPKGVVLQRISRDDVAKLHEEGFSKKQIAEKLGCSYVSVNVILNNELQLVTQREKMGILPHSEIVEYYKKGFTLVELAERYGVHFSSIRNILLKENVQLSTVGKPVKYSREEFKNLHQQGLSNAEISETLGCSISVLRKILCELGLKSNKAASIINYENLVQYYLQVKNVAKVAEHFSCNPSTVRKVLKQQGVQLFAKNSVYNSEELIKLHESGLSPLEISEKLGCTIATATRILKKYLNKPLTKLDFNNQVLELYNQGVSMQEISTNIGLPFTTVRKVVRDFNMITTPSKLGSFSEKVKEYHFLGYDASHIASILRFPVSTVRKVLKGLEEDGKNKGLVSKRKVHINKDTVKTKVVSRKEENPELASVEALIVQKLGHDEICNKLEISSDRLDIFLEKIHQQPFKAEGFECVKPIDEQGRLRTLVSRGDSAVQIAELYGVSSRDVKKWLEECCIDIPQDKKSPEKEDIIKLLDAVKKMGKPVGTVHNFGYSLGISKFSFEFLVEKYGLEPLYWSIIRGL